MFLYPQIFNHLVELDVVDETVVEPEEHRHLEFLLNGLEDFSPGLIEGSHGLDFASIAKILFLLIEYFLRGGALVELSDLEVAHAQNRLFAVQKRNAHFALQTAHRLLRGNRRRIS